MKSDMAIDRRALQGLIVGLAGMTAGVAGGLLDSPILSTLAGTAAMAAGVIALQAVRDLKDLELANARLCAELAAREGHVPMHAPKPLLDAETGLPDEWFFHLVLEGRVAAARRQLHPLTIVLFELDLDAEPASSRVALTSFVSLLRRTLRDADTACRTGPASFGLVLERTPEEGGVWVAERLQLQLVATGVSARRLSAGVASYPTHGLSAEDVLRRGRKALDRACAKPTDLGVGHVEIAHADAG